MSGSSDSHERTSAAADLCGRQLGDYRLLRRLGHGAMADVYLAEQCQLKRRVAVKVLKAELAEDRTYIRRFELEAQAAASLTHANIVQIYEVGHVDRLHYIAQEYVQGQNLREWLNRNGPPDLSHALSIMRQTAAALAKASEQGVVHRDIKPENIMLTPEGEVKVADFGLARVTRQGEATDLTQIGMTVGTPLYMSPEQIEGERLDPRSDLYSFGVTCYHMLAGAPPFSGETALGVAVQHLKSEPKRLLTLRPDLPSDLCRIVHALLEKDPANRPQSAKDVLRELRHLHLVLGEEGWPEDLPGWESAPAEAPAHGRVQLVRQLGELMKTAAATPARLPRRWLFAVSVMVAFFLGGLSAWFTARERPLLDAAIPRRETALEQYLDAREVGTWQAWESVIAYYPDREPFNRVAKQNLARIYLQQGNRARALAIFDELIASAGRNQSHRAFGLAGRYGVLTLEGKHAQAHRVLEQLQPILGKLRSAPMRKMVYAAYRENRSKLQAQERQRWDRFVAQEFNRGD